MNNLILVGTTHIIPREEIIKIIEENHPDIIGVELCKTRFELMVIPQQIKEITPNNPIGEGLIDKISQAIKKKADAENINYASDQLTASVYALENNLPLALLDRDIMETKRLMELLPPNEMQGFLGELMAFEQKSLTEQTKNLKEDEVIEQLKTKYPVAFEFLVNSRDLFIAFEILKLVSNNPYKKILVFLGKGHVKNINKLLEVE